MKVLVDGRNHGAGTNSNSACSINQSNNCYSVFAAICGVKVSKNKNESKKENC